MKICMKIRDRSLLKRKALDEDPAVLERVAAILADVRARGDAALRDLTARFDGVTLDEFRVPASHVKHARTRLSPEVLDSLHRAAGRLEKYHRKQPLTAWVTQELGGTLGQLVTPLGRVGCYVPGGTAPLPSTVLHTVTLARVAGVKDIVVATPPNPAFPETGFVNPDERLTDLAVVPREKPHTGAAAREQPRDSPVIE